MAVTYFVQVTERLGKWRAGYRFSEVCHDVEVKNVKIPDDPAMFEMILAVRDGICLSQLYVCWRLQYFNVFHILRYDDG